ncbi:hypothetical protein BST97_10660 [Nonlabens spongiae]|uniref:Type III pantothenate kinase n=1 Tax=Nonlabens spongiae TaxID=331648 RepID=A0A1W6MLR3_9FLAO|nr:type III pantothenate kinase [Nonlabens spongiae]ARN78409.1 hypothetical protein BST97_10660 [Nonlabens spongiae]
MILAIDIGNTRSKIALMDSENPLGVLTLPHQELIEQIENLCSEKKIHTVALCSVNMIDATLLDRLATIADIFQVSIDNKMPFSNNYKSNTLGNDRIALVSGAMGMSQPHEPLLIIDAGTCITYDYLDTEQVYQGGAISPGLSMRYKALHTFTAKLPLVEATNKPSTIGTTTIESIQSGVQNGAAMEIDSMIDFYLSRDPNLKIFLTGGDAPLLSEQLKNRFFAAPNLTLSGIYNLYQINKNT